MNITCLYYRPVVKKIFFKTIYPFLCVYAHVSLCVPCVCTIDTRREYSVGFLRTGATGDCIPPDVGSKLGLPEEKQVLLTTSLPLQPHKVLYVNVYIVP